MLVPATYPFEPLGSLNRHKGTTTFLRVVPCILCVHGGGFGKYSNLIRNHASTSFTCRRLAELRDRCTRIRALLGDIFRYHRVFEAIERYSIIFPIDDHSHKK